MKKEFTPDDEKNLQGFLSEDSARYAGRAAVQQTSYTPFKPVNMSRSDVRRSKRMANDLNAKVAHMVNAYFRFVKDNPDIKAQQEKLAEMDKQHRDWISRNGYMESWANYFMERVSSMYDQLLKANKNKE